MLTIDELKIVNFLLDPDAPKELPQKEASAQLEKLGLTKVFLEIEKPLMPVLEEMSNNGILIDQKRLIVLKKKNEGKIKEFEKEIYKLAGGEFNLNSPKQMSEVLFKKLGLKARGATTKTGLQSTKASKLEELKGEHKIINLILDYRELFKINSTYLEPLSHFKGRVHTTFLQTGAATGRLSSVNPNLQNIPDSVKEVFLAEEGFKLVSLDYSQIELRILAVLAKDENLIEAFKNDLDIHRLTASQVLGVSLEKVTEEERRFAKTLNFGVIYGMGATAFARNTGLKRVEAEKFIENYFKGFPKIKKFQEGLVEEARKNGYIRNLNGRIRWLKFINNENGFLRAGAEREAINAPIQGLAADIMKLALIAVHHECKKDHDVRMLLTIHDELLLEIKEEGVEKIAKIIKQTMENVYPMGVKLKVGMSIGDRWSDL